MSGVLVIFSNGAPIFKSNNAKSTDLNINAVGKGKGPKRTDVKTRASAKLDPDPIHPIFLKMEKAVDDPFWKSTFHEAAFNKFHRGFKFYNDTLSSKIRNKTQNCCLQGLTIDQSIIAVKNFMASTYNIMSTSDVEKSNQLLKEIFCSISEEYPETWSSIRSYQTKTLLISKYVENCTIGLKLCEKEEKQLYEVIKLGLDIKVFNTDTITLNKGVIYSIEGLYRKDNGEFCFDINSVKMDSQKSKKYIDPYHINNEGLDDIEIETKFDPFKKFTRCVDAMSKKNYAPIINENNEENEEEEYN